MKRPSANGLFGFTAKSPAAAAGEREDDRRIIALFPRFNAKSSSAVSATAGALAAAAAEEEDDERKRTLELLFATPMRRFSRSARNGGRRGGGTLRVRIVTLTTPSSSASSHNNNNNHSRSPSIATAASSPAHLLRNKLTAPSSSSSMPSGQSTPVKRSPGSPTPRKLSNSPFLAAKFALGIGSSSASPEPATPAPTAPALPTICHVELSLGSAKGRTPSRQLGSDESGSNTSFQDDPWIRLFIPDEDEAVLLMQAVRDAVHHQRHAMQQRRVLHVKAVMQKRHSEGDGDESVWLESALDLDSILDQLEAADNGGHTCIALPLISRAEPHLARQGRIALEVSFDRLTSAIAASSPASPRAVSTISRSATPPPPVSPLAGLPSPSPSLSSSSSFYLHVGGLGGLGNKRRSLAALSEMLPASEEEFESLTRAETEEGRLLLMAPSAAALLATCCSITLPPPPPPLLSLAQTVLPLSRRHGSLPAAAVSSVRLLRRRLSCPPGFLLSPDRAPQQDDALCHNPTQLAGLREGWRMWRLADKTQYKPSHRAQDAAMVGERFLNREAASSFFEPNATVGGGGGVFFSPAAPAWLQTLMAPGSSTVTAQSVLADLSNAWCRGKTVLLTGGTSGIGREIGRELCVRGVRRLVLLCRNLATGRTQARTWTNRYRNVEIDVIQCDLRDMLETSRALEQIKSLLDDENERLDCLVLCAATINGGNSKGEKKKPSAIAEDEAVSAAPSTAAAAAAPVEEAFAVNYLANYLIVHSLLTALSPTEARIILAGCSNSLAMRAEHAGDWDNAHLVATAAAATTADAPLGLGQYMRTKTMLSSFANELASKLTASSAYAHVQCMVFYPGAVKSKLADKVLFHVNPTLARLADAAYGLMEGVLIRTPLQGATLAVFLCSYNTTASSSTSLSYNGKVFHSGFTGEVTDFNPHEPFGVARDRDRAHKLWTQSGRLLNQVLGRESKMTEWWALLRPQRPTTVNA